MFQSLKLFRSSNLSRVASSCFHFVEFVLQCSRQFIKLFEVVLCFVFFYVIQVASVVSRFLESLFF